MTAEQGAGFAPPAGANVMRGLIVIGIAVLIGVGLMARGITSDDATTVEASTEADATAADETATDDGTTDDGTVTEEPEVADDAATATETPTEAAPVTLRDPSEVAVVVLNANGGRGIAGDATQKLDARNYVTKEPRDANSTGASTILYLEGYEADAAEIARVLGVADPAGVIALLDPASTAATSPKRQDAQVMVFVGNDGIIPT